MKKRVFVRILAGIFMTMQLTGCGSGQNTGAPDSGALWERQGGMTAGALQKREDPAEITPDSPSREDAGAQEETAIALASEIIQLEDGLFAVEFQGDDGFEAFLAQGGASSDAQVAKFLSARFLADFEISGMPFGCSAIAAANGQGERLFGRNFDWQACEALVLSSKPEKGYASISTVNMDFITQGAGEMGAALQLSGARTLAALYAPLDGMNEAGLAVSVNMIQDPAVINQDTGKPDITTTTAIRLLLNQAASVDEAIRLLEQYDLHASMGMMIHFALADASGRSVAVEYVNDEMAVVETPVVTNFYLAPGEKYGTGTAQSHERYALLIQALSQQGVMDMEDVRDALDSVSKDDFGEFESTEWSAVFNLNSGTAHYYHRENYENRYVFQIK